MTPRLCRFPMKSLTASNRHGRRGLESKRVDTNGLPIAHPSDRRSPVLLVIDTCGRNVVGSGDPTTTVPVRQGLRARIMPRQIRVFLSVGEFSTEGHEERKGLFSSRPLRPSVQSEKKAGRCICSMIAMTRTVGASPCVIRQHQERADVDGALARRLRITAINVSRING